MHNTGAAHPRSDPPLPRSSPKDCFCSWTNVLNIAFCACSRDGGSRVGVGVTKYRQESDPGAMVPGSGVEGEGVPKYPGTQSKHRFSTKGHLTPT